MPHDEMPNDEYTSLSEAELTAAIRSSDSDGPIEELYRRHQAAVLSYALACCRDRHTAEDLVSEAFARTLQAVRSGGGPEAAWRPYLLTVVRRIAADWACTARRTELSPDFEQWLSHACDGLTVESSEEHMLRLEDSSIVLRAFRSLPERWQVVLWHTAVEEEPAAKVAKRLGLGTSGVSSLVSRAREGLREAYLTAHIESGCHTDECRHYSSLLGAAVRRAGRRANKDLERHLATCDGCRGALVELIALNERLGSILPTGVLLWGSSAYVAARVSEAAASAGTAVMAPGTPDGGTFLHGHSGWRAWVKGSSLPAGVVAGSLVAAVGLTVLLLPMPPLLGDRDAESTDSQPVLAKTPPPVTIFKPLPGEKLTVTPSGSASSRRPGSPPPSGDGATQAPAATDGSGVIPLHLRSDHTLGSPESPSGSVTLPSAEGENYDGSPYQPQVFTASGVNGRYVSGPARFDLFVDAGTTVANGQQVRISYDLTGDGSWDRTETYRYFETDAVPGYEHYTDGRGLKTVTGALGDLRNGRIQVEVWNAIGKGSSTLGIGDTSVIWIPFT